MVDCSNAIDLEDVSKTFTSAKSISELLHLNLPTRIPVLDGVSLSAAEGTITGIMGPNGSGKTTILRIITGILLPDSGRALVMGMDTARDRAGVCRATGYVSSRERSFYWRLTVMENLRFFGRLHDLRGRALESQLSRAAEITGISEVMDRRFGELSTGFRQRVALARALLHDPQVLVLDEPTRSLDRQAASMVHGLLEELTGMHRTVVMATHSAREAAAMCDRTFIITERGLSDVDPRELMISTEIRISLAEEPEGTPPRGVYVEGLELVCAMRHLPRALEWAADQGLKPLGIQGRGTGEDRQ